MLSASLLVLHVVRTFHLSVHPIHSIATPNTGNVTIEEVCKCLKVILNLIKGSKVPQVFTGQVQVERTRCSLLHYQHLELDKQRKHSFRKNKKEKLRILKDQCVGFRGIYWQQL